MKLVGIKDVRVGKSLKKCKNCGKIFTSNHNQLVMCSDDCRFSSKIIKTPKGCWEWIGSKDTRGYGSFKYEGKVIKAHRYSYIKYKGNIPESMCVCHKCDNPKCVNPEHLFLGTNADNVRDKVNKNRVYRAWGELSKRTKLSNEQAMEIYVSPLKHKELALKYNVKKCVIDDIKRGRSFRNVTHEFVNERLVK